MSDSGIDEPIEAEHMEESDPVDDAEDMAEVDNHVEVDEPFQVVEEEEDGEDLAETLEKDYERIEKLDNYEGGEHMDDTKYQGMSHGQRMRAEFELRKRDRKSDASGVRRPQALADDDEEDEEYQRPIVRRRIAKEPVDGADEDEERDSDEEVDEGVNLDESNGPLHLWVMQDAVTREIRRQFRKFMREYKSGGVVVYEQRIKEMCAGNKESLDVSFMELSKRAPTLAVYVADAPKQMLQIFGDTAMSEVLKRHFPRYNDIHKEIHVRISELPICDSLRDIRKIHLSTLIKVSGVVTRRTSVFPQLKHVKFDCPKCGYTSEPVVQTSAEPVKMNSCLECSFKSRSGFPINMEQTLYRNYQKMTLQESPGSVPAGRLPRTKDVILLNDLIDQARPGEEVEVTGVYMNTFDGVSTKMNGFPVFSTVLEANHLLKKDATNLTNITEDDEAKIRSLASDPRIVDRIVKSIAPSIFGHASIKTALACALFGGVPKSASNGHRLRGDINVLILGDPGMAKSQFLKYVEKLGQRAVYTTGQGASAVGLTAAVRKDPVTGEWTLEGGALVLADNGTCLIDEFDKMNDQDRTSIHEAMEQQSISISKAGIITSLQARCSVIAAANPVLGRYDLSESFANNVNLTEPILSRFDILNVVSDTIDPEKDQNLAEHVMLSHQRSHPEHRDDQDIRKTANPMDDPDIISQELLSKYILYAKKNCQPQLQGIDMEKVEKLYQKLRMESQNTGGHPIAVRHIESLIRMAEAFCKMRLGDFVHDEDVDTAIRVMLESFINSQKFSVKNSMRRTFAEFLFNKRDNDTLLSHILRALVRDAVRFGATVGSVDIEGAHRVEVQVDEFEAQAHEHNIRNVQSFYESDVFTKSYVLNAEKGTIIKMYESSTV